MDPTPSPSSAPPPAPARLKVAGAWSGVLEVVLESWTLSMLREEVVRRSAAGDGCRVNLICSGRVLRDESHTLAQVGLKNNSKVLATVVSPDKGKALDQELASEAERSAKLTRLKAAAAALSERHANDDALPVENFNMVLENQNGQKINLGSETDQRGAMMGVMLHAKGKSSIVEENYKDAVDVLSIAEEAFSLCDPKFIEMIDNVPMLQLDIVWCYFMLRDISCLSVAGVRLSKARKGLERAHGKDSTRVRAHLGRYSELAVYLRLELLEGVVAYHNGNYEESRRALNSAQSKFNQLQVSDDTLSLLMNMGYKTNAAKRALRMTGQDIQSAVDFLVEERAKKLRRYEDNLQHEKEIKEQQKYGKTPEGKAVNITRLNELVSIGFDRALAAEALRLNENDSQLALDLLTDPNKNCQLQHKLESRKKPRSGNGAHVAASTATAPVVDNAASLAAAAAQLLDAAATAAAAAATVDNAVTEENGELENPSGAANVDQRDLEMEEELALELQGDVAADYDIEVTKEGEAIAEYLSLLCSQVSNRLSL